MANHNSYKTINIEGPVKEQELQLALAKILPEDLGVINQHVCWLDEDAPDFVTRKRPVLYTEWLHVCYLIEKELSSKQMDKYVTYIFDIAQEKQNTENIPWGHFALTLTWQQRAEALIKIINLKD